MSQGISFEQDMAAIVKRELEQGNLGISPELGHVLLNPKYYSRDRMKDITFDVSVEVYRRATFQPYLIWIWECKHYSRQAPVDDVEEFHAKLEQIGADRTKGTMITPVGFDYGALEFARSKGIGLCRYISPGSLLFLMEDSSRPTDYDIIHALTTQDTSKFRYYGRFYGLTCDGDFVADQIEFIKHEFKDT